jgi:regulation of enolase protein 1 (concanavalin A-like superfamily)
MPTLDPIIFLDDFEGGLDPAWSWHNEDPERWFVTPDGWLGIKADHPGMGNEGDMTQTNLLLQSAPEGDFIVTTRMYADPNSNFNQAGIFLIADGLNYVSIISGFCEPCLPESGGYGFYIDGVIGGEYVSQEFRIERAPEDTDVFLRLEYSAENNAAAGLYALSPDDWQPLGVINEFPQIKQIGLGAANLPHPDEEQGEDLMAYFEYVEIARVNTPVRAQAQLPQPTPTPEPTDLPVPTPLPEGVLFRDDFEGYLQPGWSWINEDPERWAFVEFDGKQMLEIVGDTPGGLAEQINTLMRPLPEGDFVLTAHILSEPFENFDQANIFIFEDKTNFIRLNLGYCEPCLPGHGHGYFMETIIDNNPFKDAYFIKRDPGQTDVYLRLVNERGSITSYYSTDQEEWTKIGAFGNYFEFKSVGLGATNSAIEDMSTEDIIALFDFFEISQP